jgi:5-methylcytosine-specific restriction protein A
MLSGQPLCVLCQREGRVAAATELDHRVPLWAGGTDAEANLDPLCSPCHSAKTAREAAERAKG